MTVAEAAKTLNFEIIAGEDALNRDIESVFCCDLLSFVMGRAPARFRLGYCDGKRQCSSRCGACGYSLPDSRRKCRNRRKGSRTC